MNELCHTSFKQLINNVIHLKRTRRQLFEGLLKKKLRLPLNSKFVLTVAEVISAST